jgi:hypothetical protein
VGLAGVLSGAAVALVTLWFTERRERQRRDHERTLKDVEELRAILDAASAAVNKQVENSTRRMMALAGLIQEGKFEDDFEYEPVDLEGIIARVVMRLGRKHQIVASLHEVTDLYSSVILAWSVAKERPVHFDTDKFIEVGENCSQLDRAADRFRDQANALVGSRLA